MQSSWTRRCIKTVLVLFAGSLLSVCEGLLSAKSLCFEVVPLSIIDCWIFEAPVEALAYEFPSAVSYCRHVSHVHPHAEHLSRCPSSSLNTGPKSPHNLSPSPWQQWTCSGCPYLLMQMMSWTSPTCQSHPPERIVEIPAERWELSISVVSCVILEKVLPASLCRHHRH